MSAEAAGGSVLLRPAPPEELVYDGRDFERFLPAHDVLRWIRQTYLDENGALFNPDHAHLVDANLGILWTSAENVRQQRRVAGTAELVNLKGPRWERARQRVQLRSWFADLPDFVITLDALYCDEADDASFCALVDHELYHCSYKRDEYGSPRFASDGRYMWALRGHDIEQFVGVTRRFGVEASGVSELIEAGRKVPLITSKQLQLACGTCA